MPASEATRRPVQYGSLDEVLDDAERLANADAPTTGQWSKGRIFEHLARGMDMSIDGFNRKPPWPMRLVGKYVIKKRILKSGMPSGFKLPAKDAAVLVPDAMTTEAGLEHLRRVIGRLAVEYHRKPHPFFGAMTNDEWNQMHRRHAELHMSFIAEP